MNFFNEAEKNRSILDNISKGVADERKFDQNEHDSQSRIQITTLFLKSYFWLIAGSFIFSFIYNFAAAIANHYLAEAHTLSYLDVSNTVSIITTTLSSGVGFVIGYYFKNKSE